MSRLLFVLTILPAILSAGSLEVPARFVLKGRLQIDAAKADTTRLSISSENHRLSLLIGQEAVSLVSKDKTIGRVNWKPQSAPFALMVNCTSLSFIVPGIVSAHWSIPASESGKLDVEEGTFARLSQVRFQPAGSISFSDDFMRSDVTLDEWNKDVGHWKLDRIPNPMWSVSPFRYRADGTGDHLATTGYWFWNNYAVRCAIRPGESEGAGLAALVKDRSNYLLFRWLQTLSLSPRRATGKLQLVRIADGKEHVLREQAGDFDPSQWYEFSIAAAGPSVYALIDGYEVFQVDNNAYDWPMGRTGLWSRNAVGALFDDVAVKSVQALKLDDSSAELAEIFGPREVVIPEIFAKDKYMEGWASTHGEWSSRSKGLGQMLWRVGSFSTAASLDWKLKWQRGVGRQPIRIAMSADGDDLGSGYHIHLLKDLEFFRQGVSLGKAELPEQISAIEWRRSGGTHNILVNGVSVGTFKDPAPLPGGRIGVYLPASTRVILDTNSIDIRSEGQLDYTFSSAPVDWRVASGAWDITSRWVCTPKWSWFGGKSHETASIWSKRSHSGDQVIDLTTAVMMDYGGENGYRRVGDINVSFCADGKNLSSGYTLMFGGYDNSMSCLWRKNQIVAVREDRPYPMPKTGLAMDAHKGWFNVKAEKSGDRIRFYLNNELIIDYRDPDPLKEGHVAAWTWDGGMMIPRVRIFADSLGQQASPFLEALGSEATRTDEFGAFKIESMKGKQRVTTFINPQSGGDFTSPLALEEFDALQMGKLSFDYRIPPEVRLHLYLNANGQSYYIAMNAPEDPASHEFRDAVIVSGRLTRKINITGESQCPVRLGAIAVQADSDWHRADLNLAVLLRGMFPREKSVTVSNVRFANWNNKDYLMSGFGGNPQGASFSVANVVQTKTDTAEPIPMPSAFASGDAYSSDSGLWDSLSTHAASGVLKTEDGRKCLEIAASHSGYRVALTTQPFDVHRFPRLEVTYKAEFGAVASVKCLAGGSWYLLHQLVADNHWHTITTNPSNVASLLRERPSIVEALVIEGADRTVADRISLHVDEWRLVEAEYPDDQNPPVASGMAPADGTRASADSIVLHVRDQGSGVDAASIKLKVNGEVFTVIHPRVTYQASTGYLRLRLAEPFENGGTVSCQMTASDRAGNALPLTQWQWTFDYSQDRIAPGAPYVVYVPTKRQAWNDFEESLGECTSRRGGTALRTDETSATGAYCVQTGGNSTFLTFRPFDVREYPIVSFDYRLPIGSQTNLMARTENVNWSIGFAGDATRSPTSTPLATLENIQADGEWHRAEFNLFEILRQAGQTTENFTVDHIATTGSRGRFGSAGSHCWFDNFCVSSREESSPSFEWSSPTDETGIAGYSILLDDQPASVPDTTLDTQQAKVSFKDLKDGVYYLHVRASDKAGNWGPAGHSRVEVQSEQK